MQTKQWTETNVSWDYVGVLNLETIIPSTNSVISFSQIQYYAKEMQTKFAEISEITRISAIKLRTFASDEKAAKFRCFYCSNVGEISQGKEINRNEISRHQAKFRPRWTKFRVIRTKWTKNEAKFRCGETMRNIVSTRRNFASTKRNFVFQEFVADYRITVIITSCKSTGTCKRDHYWKKKHRNDCYNCGEVLRQNRVFWLETFFLLLSQHNFVLNVSLTNTCISAISLKLSITCWYKA